jgi:hypothetical protein
MAQLTTYRRERTASHELGHQTPGEPELCFPGEVGGHGFTPQLELDLLTPYVDFLKSQVEHDVVAVPTGVIFQEPVFQEWVAESKKPRIEQVRDELKDIAESAKYSGDGKTL